MNIFDSETTAALEKMSKATIKAVEFEAGLTLQFVSVEKQTSQYGAAEDSSIVERGILDEGQTFLYTFKDKEGDTRKLYSTSFPFLIAMNDAEINEGDTLSILRSGKLKDTKYVIEVVQKP